MKAQSSHSTEEFQSAPLTKARGDWMAGKKSLALRSFNPLPSPKQGETHPPRWTRSETPCFNPLPSPKQGETPSVSEGVAEGTSFNPLPSPKQGETRPTKRSEKCNLSFNPLPSPKQGETRPDWSLRATASVSIRSPHQSKGRHPVRPRSGNLP